MIVCCYVYGDGICGISEAAHRARVHRVARTGHAFIGAEIRRTVDAQVGSDGKVRTVYPIKAGQSYVVDGSVLSILTGENND